MKLSEYVTRVVEPTEGYELTQAAEVAIEERVLSRKLFLGVNDSPDNWREILKEEADAYRAAQKEARKAAAAENVQNYRHREGDAT